MASLARAALVAVRTNAKEAWVYPLGWVVYFDDKAVVDMLRRGLAATISDSDQ